MARVLPLKSFLFLLPNYIHVYVIVKAIFSYLDKREVLQQEYAQPPILPSPHFRCVVNVLTFLLFAAGTLMDCYDELGNRYQLPVYVLSAPTNLIEDTSETDTATDPDSNASPGIEIPIKFRLSTGKDMRLTVHSTDTVLKVKRQIQVEEGYEPTRQRWYYSGRLLSDKMRIEEAKIPKGFVVQVIISPEEVPAPVES